MVRRFIAGNPILNVMSEEDFLFNQFWDSGIRKKDKERARVYFSYALASENNRNDFIFFVVSDIKRRLKYNRDEFCKVLPSTYLKRKMWSNAGGF